MWFVTTSDDICGEESFLALDFVVAQQGKELMGACNTDPFVLNNTSWNNAGNDFNCVFEGWLQ
jgi:hypothetical protein